MADVSHVISLGIGSPADIPHFILFGLSPSGVLPDATHIHKNSPLGPVSAAIVARLKVASLTGAYPAVGAGCTGGVTDNPQGGVFPFLWYELSAHDLSGLGQGLDVLQLELRLHVFSTWNGMLEAQRIMREAIRLLKYQEPTVSGYRLVPIGRPLDEIPLPFEELNGVKVRELVTVWDVFAEELE